MNIDYRLPIRRRADRDPWNGQGPINRAILSASLRGSAGWLDPGRAHQGAMARRGINAGH
jgi:hypothetical protein